MRYLELQGEERLQVARAVAVGQSGAGMHAQQPRADSRKLWVGAFIGAATEA